MDESRKAFIAFENMHIDEHNHFPSNRESWDAAVEWARQDERERLAKLAEDRGQNRAFCVLNAAEIRAGQLNES